MLSTNRSKAPAYETVFAVVAVSGWMQFTGGRLSVTYDQAGQIKEVGVTLREMRIEKRQLHMETEIIDLHVHSTCSDGTLTPSELVELAVQKGLKAFALTDHDCVLGVKEAQDAAKRLGGHLEVIPGVELSCDYNGKEVHVVGLYIDTNQTYLNQQLEDFCHSRDIRTQEMVERLSDAGLPISYEALTSAYPESVITRAHIARYLVEIGAVKDRSTVFSKYIGDNCPYFVSREKITPQEGIALIHQTHGLAFLAHPVLYHMSTVTLDTLTAELAASGLDGIEAVYSTYQPGDEQNIRTLAKKYGLLISGGSDFHGANKPHITLGSGTRHMPIPAYLLAEIKSRL